MVPGGKSEVSCLSRVAMGPGDQLLIQEIGAEQADNYLMYGFYHHFHKLHFRVFWLEKIGYGRM